jgi:hypothetical protein
VTTRQDRFLARAALVANVVLASGALAAVLVFLYFFYRYTWSAERQFTSVAARLLYYGVPVTIAVILLAALRLKRDHRINLAIVSVVLVLSVYAGELVLHLIEPEGSRPELPIMIALHASDDRTKLAARLTKEFGVKIDTRDRFQVLNDLRGKGIDAVPSVIPRYQLRYQQRDDGAATAGGAPRLVAFGGISNKLTTLCNENGQMVTYESDEHGFRNPKGLWQRDRIEIVALGDSFTQGHCVPPGKAFVDVVRQHYPATLNLGMAGEGPLLMLATMKEYARPFRPRIVLWFYFEGNDLVDLQEEQTSPVLMRYLERTFSQHLPERQREVDAALREFVEKETARETALREARKRNRRGVIGSVVELAKLPAVRSKLGLVQGRTAEEAELANKMNHMKVDLFRRVLSDAKSTVAAWGGTLYFVYLPNWTRFDARLRAFDQRLAEAQRDKVLKVAGDLDLPIVDLLPTFQSERDPMSSFPFRAPGHYTESGHRLVGEQVVKALAGKGAGAALGR